MYACARPFDHLGVMQRVTFAAVLVALLLGTLLLAFTARNEYCLPWQHRVGIGDGPFGPEEDYSFCR
jgi:hypothetical protein